MTEELTQDEQAFDEVDELDDPEAADNPEQDELGDARKRFFG